MRTALELAFLIIATTSALFVMFFLMHLPPRTACITLCGLMTTGALLSFTTAIVYIHKFYVVIFDRT